MKGKLQGWLKINWIIGYLRENLAHALKEIRL
jgi:hypothetical protein